MIQAGAPDSSHASKSSILRYKAERGAQDDRFRGIEAIRRRADRNAILMLLGGDWRESN